MLNTVSRGIIVDILQQDKVLLLFNIINGSRSCYKEAQNNSQDYRRFLQYFAYNKRSVNRNNSV
jgi:hypothetical protein